MCKEWALKLHVMMIRFKCNDINPQCQESTLCSPSATNPGENETYVNTNTKKTVRGRRGRCKKSVQLSQCCKKQSAIYSFFQLNQCVYPLCSYVTVMALSCCVQSKFTKLACSVVLRTVCLVTV